MTELANRRKPRKRLAALADLDGDCAFELVVKQGYREGGGCEVPEGQGEVPLGFYGGAVGVERASEGSFSW